MSRWSEFWDDPDDPTRKDRPDGDLTEYAASRGLEFKGSRPQMGYTAAFPMTPELTFNVVRGTLPGGEEGVVFHEVKLRNAYVPMRPDH
jgi:hypothetical protein